MSVTEEIEKARASEAYICYEFYRLVKSALLRGVDYPDSKCKFTEVLPEFRVEKGRADLIVFASKYGGAPQPYLVIETKVRALSRPGPSVAAAIRKAKSYAEKLNMISGFFATYDGWLLLIFRDVPPYLIGAYGTVTNEYEVECLLKGLEEYSCKRKFDLLSSLPKAADREFLIKRIFPSVTKEFAQNIQQQSDLLGSWKQLFR